MLGTLGAYAYQYISGPAARLCSLRSSPPAQNTRRVPDPGAGPNISILDRRVPIPVGEQLEYITAGSCPCSIPILLPFCVLPTSSQTVRIDAPSEASGPVHVKRYDQRLITLGRRPRCVSCQDIESRCTAMAFTFQPPAGPSQRTLAIRQFHPGWVRLSASAREMVRGVRADHAHNRYAQRR